MLDLCSLDHVGGGRGRWLGSSQGALKEQRAQGRFCVGWGAEGLRVGLGNGGLDSGLCAWSDQVTSGLDVAYMKDQCGSGLRRDRCTIKYICTCPMLRPWTD